MNRRQKKKKHDYEEKCQEIWGYVISYAEFKYMERNYHENVIVQHNYRTITDFSDIEELSNILGIQYENQKNIKYHYPNRFRYKTYRKIENTKISKIL